MLCLRESAINGVGKMEMRYIVLAVRLDLETRDCTHTFTSIALSKSTIAERFQTRRGRKVEQKSSRMLVELLEHSSTRDNHLHNPNLVGHRVITIL